MSAKIDDQLKAKPALSDDESGRFTAQLEPPAPAGALPSPAPSDGFDELWFDEAAVVESGAPPALDAATTGVHRRISTPPPVPEEALRHRASQPPGQPPGFGRARRTSTPPPPPPPMPADFAALRSQLQRVNGRYNELLCERARLERQLEARDRALDTLRLQNADLERMRADRSGVNELVRPPAEGPATQHAAGSESPAPAIGEQELAGLRADRQALLRLREDSAGFAAMRIELERLRETHVDGKRLRAALDELAAANAERERLRARLVELETRKAAPDPNAEALASLREQVAELAQQRDQQAGLAASAIEELEGLRAEVAELQGRLSGQAMADAEALESARAERDRFAYELRELRDRTGEASRGLDAITGIGPTFANRLRKLGVDLSAIATWDERDIERVAAEIQTQPARIVRQRWVEQAQALLGD